MPQDKASPTDAIEPVGSSFRPRARLLQLLGDQLIGSPRLAVFELVKNAYDADASMALVTMRDLQSDSAATITVIDDGAGMSRRTLEEIWLVPGHDHKAEMRRRAQRTQKGRLPLGEKGVGRFAVHKLGDKVEVVTREAAASTESVMAIDWQDVGSAEFLDEVRISILERKPEVFAGTSHGTKVAISSLRGAEWTRREVRQLARQISSISSPFQAPTDFEAKLRIPDQPRWLEDLPNVQSLLDYAPWKFEFSLTDNQFEWKYAFRGVPGVKLEVREIGGRDMGILLNPEDLPEKDRAERAPGEPKAKAVRSTIAMATGIGEVRGVFYVFDRDQDVLAKMGHSRLLQSLLDESGGVRVYRDGIRVYNYGEAGDDWLGLDLRRINSPSKRISNNIVIASIELNLAQSTDLTEKTNREGFVENVAYRRLKALVLGAVAQLESERSKDKAELRKLLAKDRSSIRGDIEQPLKQIVALARKTGIATEIAPLVDRAQKAYDDMKSTMLRAGVSGMSLVVVYHEIDHGVRLLQEMLKKGVEPPRILDHARQLVGVLDGFGDLVRRGEAKPHTLQALVHRASQLNSVRLSNHKVDLEISTGQAEAVVNLPAGLALGAITNLIDNSIYWLSARWPSNEFGDRKIHLGVNVDLFPEGPSIVVADNGPGFADDLAHAVEPFFTRRPDGIGVGLYYVNLIMQTIGGSLRSISPSDAGLSSTFDGAVLALTFRRA